MKLHIDSKKLIQWLKYLLVAILTANGEQLPDLLSIL
jgi:hypothetical protein